MAKPFAWRDFEKRWRNLNTQNFPTLDKSKQLQNTVNVKLSSKAEKGVSFDSKIVATNEEKTDAEFSTKFKLNDLKGTEFGFKAKTKPAVELSVKVDDSVFPVEGAVLTIVAGAAGKNEQNVGASMGYANETANVNVGFKLPVTQKIVDFIEDGDDLAAQKTQLFADFVVKPSEERLIYVGGSGNLKLPREGEALAYQVKGALSYQDSVYEGGLYVESQLKESASRPINKTGVWAFSKVDEVSLGAHAGYELECEGKFKGFSVETSASVQRDFNSKLSAKVQVIPDTIVSLGYEQKLNHNVKLSFGYAFLLNKASEPSKTKSSAFQIGVNISH